MVEDVQVIDYAEPGPRVAPPPADPWPDRSLFKWAMFWMGIGVLGGWVVRREFRRRFPKTDVSGK